MNFVLHGGLMSLIYLIIFVILEIAFYMHAENRYHLIVAFPIGILTFTDF